MIGLTIVVGAVGGITAFALGVMTGRDLERRNVDGIVREGGYLLGEYQKHELTDAPIDPRVAAAFRIALEGYETTGRAI